MTQKESVIQGAIVLVVVQVALVCDLYNEARAKLWPQFWLDLALLFGLAMVTGFVIIDTINHRRRLKRKRETGTGP